MMPVWKSENLWGIILQKKTSTPLTSEYILIFICDLFILTNVFGYSFMSMIMNIFVFKFFPKNGLMRLLISLCFQRVSLAP